MKKHPSLQSCIDDFDLEICRSFLLDAVRPYWQSCTAIGGTWPPPRPHKLAFVNANVPEWVNTADGALALIDRVGLSPDAGTDDPALDAVVKTLCEVNMSGGELRTSDDQLKWVVIKLVSVMNTERQIVADANLGQKKRIACAQGGRATSQRTPEIVELARSIFNDVKRPRVSDTAAYQRTRVLLAKNHGIDLSVSTLKRYLK